MNGGDCSGQAPAWTLLSSSGSDALLTIEDLLAASDPVKIAQYTLHALHTLLILHARLRLYTPQTLHETRTMHTL